MAADTVGLFSFYALKTLVMGQSLSLLMGLTAVSTTGLTVWYHISAPCLQSFLCYLLLACTFGAKVVSSEDFLVVLKKHGWKYMIVAVFDVEANYFIIKAYNYTTLTSVQLCDGFAIPSVVILSVLFLKTRYSIIHYIGVALCILGNVCLVLTDNNSKSGNAPNPVLGDLLALLGAFLYGCSNAAQEHFVKNHSVVEFIGMLSLFASVISGAQVYIVERDILLTTESSWKVGGLLAIFVAAQYCFYVVTPIVMQRSSATLVNLSLITADFLNLAIGIYLFKYKFSYYFILAFAGVVGGLILYNSKPVEHMGNNDKCAINNEIEAEETENSNSEGDIITC